MRTAFTYTYRLCGLYAQTTLIRTNLIYTYKSHLYAQTLSVRTKPTYTHKNILEITFIMDKIKIIICS